MSKFTSRNAKHVTGIDIQGDAKGIKIEENFIHIMRNSNDKSTVFKSLIVGENADDRGAGSTIIIDGNMFFQPQYIQNMTPTRRQLRITPLANESRERNDGFHHGHHRMKGGVGCPFSS